MKTITSLLIFGLFISFASQSISQVDWTKHEQNPLLVPGESGTWNDISMYPFCVLFLDDMYHMWYGGHDGSHGRIGYASSEDGITWIPHERNPVLDVGPGGSWEDVDVHSPYVLYEDTTFHMWYTGFSGSESRIGYATSTDMVTWTKYEGNPVLDYGLDGDWDYAGVFDPCIYFDGTTYHMWYSGTNVNSTIMSIGYATSTDRITWNKYKDKPVLTSDRFAWDSPHIRAPHVLFDGTEYHMWYNGMTETSGLNFQIGYATSTNMVTWEKDENNPILKPTDGGWDSRWVGFPYVLWDGAGEQFKMWYGGGSQENSNGQIGYATAPPSPGTLDEFVHDFPCKFRLMQNFPNPFNPVTIINYQLPMTSDVDLSIYNLLGQKVATLVNERRQAGYHQAEWDASGYASGIYYYRIEAGDFQDVKKMIMIK
jgi:predicted GH43/DUF377 family glycosyl hydrolase